MGSRGMRDFEVSERARATQRNGSVEISARQSSDLNAEINIQWMKLRVDNKM